MAVRCCLAGCIALAAVAIWATYRDALLAKYWENELAAASGEDAAEAIKQLMTLRRHGLAAVVRAVGLPDQRAQFAYLELCAELDRYESDPSDEAISNLETFADALAANIDALPAAARQQSAKLAMRILLWPEETPKLVDRTRLIAACDRVLKTSVSQSTRPLRPKPIIGKTAIGPHRAPSAKPAQPRTLLPVDRSMYLELAELAPPDLPRADRAGSTLPAQPGLLFSSDAEALVAANDRAKASDGRRVGQAAEVSVAAYTHEVDTAQTEQDVAQAARLRMRSLGAIELFAQLNEPRETAATAAAELDARGFSPRQIEVGRHLSSTDASERLRWAEALPGIRGIDARFWLLRLSRDPNLQIRRAAIGLLSTDRDPEVIRRLRQVIAEENDPELCEQVGRALEVLEGP